MIAVLLECGANAAARNKAGKTALHLAVRHPIGKERNRLAEAVLLVSPRFWASKEVCVRCCQWSCQHDWNATAALVRKGCSVCCRPQVVRLP